MKRKAVEFTRVPRHRSHIPNAEASGSDSSVISSGEQVAARTEVRGNDAVDLKESLGVFAGLESAHSPFAFTSRLMRVLRAVVQTPMLPVSNTGQHNSFCCPVAPELVCNNDARLATSRPQ